MKVKINNNGLSKKNYEIKFLSKLIMIEKT